MGQNWTTDEVDERNRKQAAEGFASALCNLAEVFPSPDAGPSGIVGYLKPQRKPRTHPERDLEKACSDLLQYDGWRQIKMEWNFSERKRVSVGEEGMADRLYIRYNTGVTPQAKPQDAQVVWIEWKAPKGKASTAQRFWIAQERALGALVLLAGKDFPATIDGFCAWYRHSGLMRKSIYGKD